MQEEKTESKQDFASLAKKQRMRELNKFFFTNPKVVQAKIKEFYTYNPNVLSLVERKYISAEELSSIITDYCLSSICKDILHYTSSINVGEKIKQSPYNKYVNIVKTTIPKYCEHIIERLSKRSEDGGNSAYTLATKESGNMYAKTKHNKMSVVYDMLHIHGGTFIGTIKYDGLTSESSNNLHEFHKDYYFNTLHEIIDNNALYKQLYYKNAHSKSVIDGIINRKLSSHMHFYARQRQNML